MGTANYQCSEPSTVFNFLAASAPEWIQNTVYRYNSTYATDSAGNWYNNTVADQYSVTRYWYCHRTEFNFNDMYGTENPMRTTAYRFQDTNYPNDPTRYPYPANRFWETNEGAANASWTEYEQHRDWYSQVVGYTTPTWRTPPTEINALNEDNGGGNYLMPGCVKYSHCLYPHEWYTYVPLPVVTVQPNNTVIPPVTTLWMNNEWEEDRTAEEEDIKTWTWYNATNTDNLEWKTHEYWIEWEEPEKKKFYVENDTYCVGTIHNNLKQRRRQRKELDSYVQEAKPETYILNAQFNFEEVADGIRIFYANQLKAADWNLYNEWDGENVIIPELMEDSAYSGGVNWRAHWYKWVAINTGDNGGYFTLAV